jgi:hypothetical protein
VQTRLAWNLPALLGAGITGVLHHTQPLRAFYILQGKVGGGGDRQMHSFPNSIGHRNPFLSEIYSPRMTLENGFGDREPCKVLELNFWATSKSGDGGFDATKAWHQIQIQQSLNSPPALEKFHTTLFMSWLFRLQASRKFWDYRRCQSCTLSYTSGCSKAHALE